MRPEKKDEWGVRPKEGDQRRETEATPQEIETKGKRDQRRETKRLRDQRRETK